LVLHRKGLEFSVYSTLDTEAEILHMLAGPFQDSSCGEQYVVVDTQGTGNAIVGAYTVEKRVIYREVGAMERSCGEHTIRVKVGDGAYLVRYYG